MTSIFSIPISRKRQISMRRKFFFFSIALFLLIFSLGSTVFIILMNKIHYYNVGRELTQLIEIERLKLEATINSEIVLALRMADSPLIREHFLRHDNEEMRQMAFKEIAGYRKAFTGKNVFWISDNDKKYYFNEEYVYTLNSSDESSGWYNSIMKNPEPYNFNVNFDIGIKKTMLWINAPVFDDNRKPIGIVGTGMNLSDFINITYQNHLGSEDLYFLILTEK